MQIQIVNPNTTAAMTERIAAAARAAAAPGTEILADTAAMGPESIEGYYDEALSLPGLIERLRARPEADGHVIACFDDGGLDAARAIARAPVVGIGEAAFHLACLLAGRFSVVTTLSRSIPALEHNLTRYGLAARCARVRAAEVPVLDLERPGSEARALIGREIAAAIAEDRAEAIVLGCAGMADLAAELAREHGLPVVDGVAAAVKLAEALAALGLATSRLGGYARPRAKAYAGPLAGFAPVGDQDGDWE